MILLNTELIYLKSKISEQREEIYIQLVASN